MQRILIDGRFVGVGESISRYTLEVVKGVLELDKVNDYTLLVRPQGKKTAKEFLSRPERSEVSRDSSLKAQNDKLPSTHYSLPSNLHLKVLDIPHYSLSEQTKLLNYLNQERFDLVHFTQFNHPTRYRGEFVVCIHDLTLLGHLYRMNPLKRLGFKEVMKSAAKNSTKIITISEYSKRDIVKTYGADPKKIVVTYLAIDEKYNIKERDKKDEIKEFKQKYGIGGDYILYTGMWKRHKNLVRMLKAFEMFIKKDNQMQLVLVGKVDKNEPEVISEIERINKMTEISGQPPVITTGFVGEEELPIAYAGALFYCIPSLSEGFGLPPVEAMACGTPVISAKISAMPEILGDAAMYFDPYSVEDIEKAMEKLFADKKLREQLSKKGIEQAKKYDWKTTAKETLEVYKNI